MRDETLCFEGQPAEESILPVTDTYSACIFAGMSGMPADGSHRCGRPNEHAGPHTCECGTVWARGERLTGYRCLMYQASEPLVTGEVPEVTLLDLAILQQRRSAGIHVMAGPTIAMGRHENGGLVWYNVAGWDPIQQALVLHLDSIYEATRKDRPSNTDGCIGTVG